MSTSKMWSNSLVTIRYIFGICEHIHFLLPVQNLTMLLDNIDIYGKASPGLSLTQLSYAFVNVFEDYLTDQDICCLII